MKKQFLLLMACALMFSSCSSNNNQAAVQSEIDSTVNVNVAKRIAENAAKNDSTLKAIEKEKAAAIEKERIEEKKQAEKALNTPAPLHADAPAVQPVAKPGGSQSSGKADNH